jgi:hypothetical protein
VNLFCVRRNETRFTTKAKDDIREDLSKHLGRWWPRRREGYVILKCCVDPLMIEPDLLKKVQRLVIAGVEYGLLGGGFEGEDRPPTVPRIEHCTYLRPGQIAKPPNGSDLL